MSALPWISWLLLAPLAGAAVVVLLPARATAPVRLAAALAALAALCTTTVLWALAPEAGEGGLRWVERAPWIRGIRAEYHVGLDGLSLPLAWVATLVFFVAATASRSAAGAGKTWFALLLLLEAAVLGTLASLDLFLFSACLELACLASYLLVATCGGERRAEAAAKLALYGGVASLLLWLAVVALRLEGGTFSIPALTLLAREGRLTGANLPGAGALLGAPFASWCFGCLCVAFLVRAAGAPFHRWLQDGAAEVPAPIAAALAGVATGLGGYGLLRLGLPCFPELARELAPAALALGAITAVVAGLAALAERDVRRLAVLLATLQTGVFLVALGAQDGGGLRAAALLLFHRGLAAPLLLFALERGPASSAAMQPGARPKLGLRWLALLAAIGVPGGSGFVPAWLTVLAAFQSRDPRAGIAACAACLALVLGAAAVVRSGREATLARSGQGADRVALELALLVLASATFGALPFLLFDALPPELARGFGGPGGPR